MYKTQITITVLSDEPLGSYEVGEIYENYTRYPEFVCAGEERIEFKLTNKQMVESMLEAGADPEFFMLDQDGNEIF